MDSLNFTNLPFLADIGLSETNKGCFRAGEWVSGEATHTSVNPHDNSKTAVVELATLAQYDETVEAMLAEKEKWMNTPAPARGEIVRQIGEELRKYKDQLGSLVSLETGKIKAEGDGEVQEAIDICDLACGLSRSITGSVIPSERPGHFMLENWNPYGIVGVITAFNFPVAVHSWNAAIALICGDLVLWKGAPSTPLCTIALTKIYSDVLARHGFNSVATCVLGEGHDVGVKITEDERIPVVSFTGSTKVGGIV